MSTANYLQTLKRHYRQNPIVLYTGAGVSRGNDIYGLPGWWDLLRKILERCSSCNSDQSGKEDSLPDEPWQAADKVVEKCKGVKNFQANLTAIVQASQNYTAVHRQLSKPFLDVATTLNSVAAFSARLNGQVNDAQHVRFAVGPNPRICAVLTSNYDPFLEAASSSKFIRPLLKPVAAFGSQAGRLDQIPVFHIHGYVPHPWQRSGRLRKPLHDRLVLTSDDYKKAWNRKDAFGVTMAQQIHYLRHYVTLFVGFSFEDKYVCSLLKELKNERKQSDIPAGNCHYAMVSTSLLSKNGADFFDEIGVRPIVYKKHEEIVNRLGQLYIAGLAADYKSGEIPLPWVAKRTHAQMEGFSLLSKSKYWQALLACRDSALANAN